MGAKKEVYRILMEELEGRCEIIDVSQASMAC
jgi:hypothetical protein